MKYTIIKNEKQYDEYVERIGKLMDSELNTPEGDELELLALIVSAYDEEHYPVPKLKWWERLQCWWEDQVHF